MSSAAPGRTLSMDAWLVIAVEARVMDNLMLVQIALLAWLFLGEQLDGRQLLGLAIAFSGVLAVQLAGAFGRPPSGRIESAQ